MNGFFNLSPSQDFFPYPNLIHNTWLRDPLAVRIFSKEMAEEKLNYLHYNPLQSHWNLCKMPDEYRFSSAAFYETGRDEFNLVTNIMQAF